MRIVSKIILCLRLIAFFWSQSIEDKYVVVAFIMFFLASLCAFAGLLLMSIKLALFSALFLSVSISLFLFAIIGFSEKNSFFQIKKKF